jgi:hypothetical protein
VIVLPNGFNCSTAFCAMTRSAVRNSACSTPLRLNSAFLKAANELACSFSFKETALPFSRFPIVHHEFEMRTIAVAVFASPDFACPHTNTVVALLP